MKPSKRYLSYIILIPTIVFLFLFTYLPLARSFIDSMYDVRLDVASSATFVGLENFYRLLQDNVFWISIKNNIIYFLVNVIPSLLLALFLAVMLTENTRISRILRSIFFLPTIIPLVSAATLWIFIFTPGIGLLDYYLIKLFNLDIAHNYLGMPDSVLTSLALVGIWKFTGYFMLFFIAGLHGISRSAQEAAIMEGCSKSQVFFNITLPLLRPTINFVLIIAFVYSFTQIDHILVMTNGGPNNASSVVLHYIQNLVINSNDLGKASAATFVALLFLFVFSITNLHILEKSVHYEH